MKKTYYNWNQIEKACIELHRQIYFDSFIPEYVVGVTRGGLIPAVMLSQFLNVKMDVINISLLDDSTDNHIKESLITTTKNILIVDDINDTGDTLSAIASELNVNQKTNIKFATIVNNEASKFTVNYSVFDINKSETPEWIVYPWEEFWLQ